MPTDSNDTEKRPSLLDKILTWSEKQLPEWQRDALRRLFHNASMDLAADDYEELYALLKKQHKLPIAKDISPKPLASEHIPSVAAQKQHATLKSMRDLRYVNKIVPGQSLQFSSQGMTIVYGGNGAGKSGYTRVLKRACRARDQTEAVHVDATDPTQAGKIPEAVFDIELARQAKAVAWALNKPAPDELASIAVFDSKCARAYLTTEGNVAYIPFGLDVVGALATKVLPEIEKKLSAEIASIDTDLTALDGLRGNTQVGELIEKISAKTNAATINKLATTSETEIARLAELDKTLAEEDPESLAKKLRLEVQRVQGLLERLGGAVKIVDDDAVKGLKALDDSFVTTNKAVENAASTLRADETLLPGTGDDIWRQMFDAARKYSIEIAYKDCEFPHLDAGALCPLCQQDVAPAADRLRRFEDFLKAEVAKKSREASATLADATATLKSTPLDLQLEEALAAELKAHSESVPDEVMAFGKLLESRRSAMLDNADKHDWSVMPALEGDCRGALRGIAKTLNDNIATLDNASDGEKRQRLVKERDELKARTQLKIELKNVTRLLENLKTKAALEDCRKDLKTTAISTRAKSFAEEAVTGALREALDDEFRKLGGVPFELKLSDRADKGSTKYKLQMAAGVGARLEEILSEGEQRAIAIGSFLAELSLAGHKAGIVFDDPVSSLDHQRKRHIAKRLAEEAKHRQVVIFTHDLAFLALLQEELDAVSAPYSSHWLERESDGQPGRVKLDDTPAGTRAYRDTKLGKESIKKAEALAGADRVNLLRQSAGQLRRTLEEIVQLHLFKDVVTRWRENLMITKLPSIHWDDNIADEINALNGELSRIIEAHSHTEEYIGGMPEVDELNKLAERVDAVIKEAKKQRGKS